VQICAKILTVFFVSLLFGITANATSRTVTKTNDGFDGVCDADCTLREAINLSVPGDLVGFSPLFDTPQVINLNMGMMTFNGLTIVGPGSNLLTLRSVVGQGPISRIFNINGGTLDISGMTITGGNVNGAGGGAIAIGSGSNATLTDIVVTGNFAGGTATASTGGISISGGTLNLISCAITNNVTSNPFEDTGGGIWAFSATLNMTNTTVSGNSSTQGAFNGGGVYINGTATITNCTITNNQTVGAPSAGGLFNGGFGNVLVRNSIIAANVNNTSMADIGANGGAYNNTSSFNLIGNVGSASGFTVANNNQMGTGGSPLNPQLYPLGNYGGRTPTHALRASSTAIDRPGANGPPFIDQRGVERPVGTSVDIGAFEYCPMVTNLADSGTGSLRDTVFNAPLDGIVLFERDFFNAAPRVIDSPSSEIIISGTMTIVGTGANRLTVRNTAPFGMNSRVFRVEGGSNVTISGMTISGGNAFGFAGGIQTLGGNLTLIDCHITNNVSGNYAGGIFNAGGALVLERTTVSGNTKTAGGNPSAGGILSLGGSLTLNNSTVSGNTVQMSGTGAGGVMVGIDSIVVIRNSTISNNSANLAGNASGLLEDATGSVTVRNSVIAGNQNNASFPDTVGAFASQGYNLIGNVGTATGFGAVGDQIGSSSLAGESGGKLLAPAAVLDPGLAPLGLYGNPVPVQPPNFNSPLIDKGNSFGLLNDQRGQPRPIDFGGIPNAPGGDGADIGAIELQFQPLAATTTISGRVVDANGRALVGVRITFTDQEGVARSAATNPLGYFQFEQVEVGQIMVLALSHKRYQFAPQAVTVTGDLSDLEFVALP
jgi:CSLREA domain-containing protein